MPDWTMRWSRRTLIATVVATATLGVALVGTAHAGGSWFYPVADRYEPGETATLVGYSGRGSYGTPDDGPFYGYLFAETESGGPAAGAIPLPLGQIDVTASGHNGYLTNRAAITFEIPDWVPAGIYFFEYCNAGCEQRLGSLIGGYVYIGVDPAVPLSRDWAYDEPEIVNLAGDALLTGPGTETTAAALLDRLEEKTLTTTYRECVKAAGFEANLAAQVLADGDGKVWHVKTSPEVPAKFHGPCFEAIGGPATTSSSWGLVALPD